MLNVNQKPKTLDEKQSVSVELEHFDESFVS